MKTAICKHCGHQIQGSTYGGKLYWYHPNRPGKEGGLQRCQQDVTEYGYNAEPIGEPCANPCLGDVKPDPNERTE